MKAGELFAGAERRENRGTSRAVLRTPRTVFPITARINLASYRAAGPNAGSEPERKGPAEPSETRKLDGTH